MQRRAVLAINATEADFDWLVQRWGRLDASRKLTQELADQVKAETTATYRQQVKEKLGIELPWGE